MVTKVRKLQKALLLLCILLFLIDLGHDGRIGPAKRRIGWGHGNSLRQQTEAYSQAIRPLPQKIKKPFMPYVNTAITMLHIEIQRTCKVVNLIQKYHFPCRSSGGVPF